MLRFESDYLEGAHPKVLDALVKTNFEQTPGYGVDEYCERARKKIRAEIGSETCGIHFLTGGTQANLTACAAFMKPWQGVLCAETGHIAVHESGSVEATGHKVLTLPHTYGKISATEIEKYCAFHYAQDNFEHTVQPGMVYISQPTEYGTLYSLDELTKIKAVCEKYSLNLFVDGARLIYGLASKQNDVSLKDLARLTDAFYIGGTKAGLLFGEALVINKKELDASFRYMLKQRGGMLAKGRILGLQYDALFTDDLYKEIGAHAISLSDKICEYLISKGVRFSVPSPTNQLFPIFSDKVVAALKNDFSLSFWEKTTDGQNIMRICTSWATSEEAVDKLLSFFDKIL